jgi:histidine triad (HIT) family protein
MRRPACIFCDIIAGDRPASVVYRDDLVVAVASPEPKARVHLLLVPRRHMPSVDALTTDDRELWGHLLHVAQKLARQQGIDVDTEGYQLVTNAGRHASRQFPHLHVHLLSGTPCQI